MLEFSPRVSVLVHMCDARATRRCVRNALRNKGHKSWRRKQNAHVAIDSHISAPVWWVLRAVASQVAGPGGHDADAPVDVAIELCASVMPTSTDDAMQSGCESLNRRAHEDGGMRLLPQWAGAGGRQRGVPCVRPASLVEPLRPT